jgi:predicted methyltransferase
MRRSWILAVSASVLLASGVAGAASAQMQMSPTAYAGALADPVRTDADKARDETRHTAETLAFAEVMPGPTNFSSSTRTMPPASRR